MSGMPEEIRRILEGRFGPGVFADGWNTGASSAGIHLVPRAEGRDEDCEGSDLVCWLTKEKSGKHVEVSAIWDGAEGHIVFATDEFSQQVATLSDPNTAVACAVLLSHLLDGGFLQLAADGPEAEQ